MRLVATGSASRLGRPAGLVLAAAALAALGGCQVKRGQPDLVNGKRLFVSKCGSCHILGRADTKGKVGPNLDQAFQAALGSGFGRSSVRGIVEKQILYPARTGQMPAKLVTGRNAQDVAAYVAFATAKPGKDAGALAAAVGPTSGPGAIFVQQGCGGCHTLSAAKTAGTTGPDLDKVLKGKPPAFIHESIVNPNAVIAPGYSANVMPQTYGRELSKQQLDALVAYLEKVAK